MKTVNSKKAKIANCKIIITKVVVLSLLIFVREVMAQSKVVESVKLYEELQEVNTRKISEMTFELANAQPALGGVYEKFIVKGSDSNLWLFKCQPEEHVNKTVAVSQFANFCGVNVNKTYEIELPINGRLVYGSIQKMLTNVISLDEKPLCELTSAQINQIQRQLVLDWFIINRDVHGRNYLIREDGQIVGIDKDGSFCLKDRSLSISEFIKSAQPDWSYYNKFWNAYIKKEIDINWVEMFELIEYIQSIDDIILKRIFESVFDKKFSADILVLRKKCLKREFMKFYQELVKKRQEISYSPFQIKSSRAANDILEILNEEVKQKRSLLKEGKIKENKKQKNIEILYSPRGRELVWMKGKRGLNISNVITELKNLRKQTTDIYEKLALSLYLLKCRYFLGRELNLKAFYEMNSFEWRVAIPRNPKKLNIQVLEYELRTCYGKKCRLPPNIKTFQYKKTNGINNQEDFMSYVRYIDVMASLGKVEDIKKELKNKLNEKPGCPLYQLLWILINDPLINPYLMADFEKIDDNCAWKHIVLGVLNGLKGHRDIEKTEYLKVINLNTDKLASYEAHTMLGYLYENNDKDVRFGKGFELDAAIVEFKEALKIKPSSIEAHLNLGVLYMIKGMPDEMLAELREVERLDPEYARKQFHFGEDFCKKSFKNKKEFMEALRINSLSNEDYYFLGLALAVKENYRLAMEYFDRAKNLGYGIDELERTLGALSMNKEY